MTTLTDFLLARIAEDEAVARAAIRDEPQPAGFVDGERVVKSDDGKWAQGAGLVGEEQVEGIGITIYDEGGHTAEQARHIARHDPVRVLAECEAKRRIVEWVVGAQAAAGEPPGMDPQDAEALTHALRLLALPFADHPEYDERWRP